MMSDDGAVKGWEWLLPKEEWLLQREEWLLPRAQRLPEADRP